MSDNELTDILDEESSTRFCAGCNIRFRAAEFTVCPRCGEKARPVKPGSLIETMMMKTITSDDLESDAQADPREPLSDLIGRTLHVYELESLIGSGAMGRVFLARHRDLHRRCALKILSPKVVKEDVDYVDRFRHEARAAAALVHPNIVTTHAIGEFAGLHFLEMEYVAGPSLQKVIDAEGALTPVRSMALALGIAEGLAVAHREQIVHRDLKLDNVLLTSRGIPKIADFGLAKRIIGEDGLAHKLVGTPNFMAPELLTGQPATPASDVYALGVCLFLMLSGEFPFTAQSFAELRRQVNDFPLPDIREFSPHVNLESAECLSLLLAKTPQNRPQNGIEAAQLIRAVCGHLRDIESLLIEAFGDSESVTWQRNGRQYLLELRLPDGRQQRLIIEPSDHAASERLLLIYSVCCAAHPDYYEEALRLNSEIPHGGLAVREVDGRDCFVMVDTYPRATVDAEEVRRSALEVAFRADAVEHQLTGKDEH